LQSLERLVLLPESQVSFSKKKKFFLFSWLIFLGYRSQKCC
jgi:hypothetical protein